MKINELVDGCTAQLVLLVGTLSYAKTKTGRDYCDISCMDSTGSIVVKVWDLAIMPVGIASGDIVSVSGACNEFNGALQIKANIIKVVSGATYSKEDFYPASRFSLDSLLKSFNKLMEHVQDPWLRLLLDHFFVKDSQFFEKFIAAPAAVTVHQNYLHGLLEHTVCVARNALMIAKNYSCLNVDVVVTASLLHDVGKVYEISEFPTLEYTDVGHLMGHVYYGSFMVQQACDSISGFPLELKQEIVHCILAHSGKLEWGSPVVPSSPEAYAVHVADFLDSKMALFQSSLEGVKDGEWSQHSRYLGTSVHRLRYEGEDLSDG